MLTRAWTLLRLGQTILVMVRGRTTVETLPAPSAMARLQATAFHADGLPRLAARFISSYTQTSAKVIAPPDELDQRLLRADIRLLSTVGRAAGFAIGQDMGWVIDCANVLAADALADQVVRTAVISVNSSSGADAAQHLLHLMGQEHLVSGRHDPAVLRTAGLAATGSSLAMRRLREGTVATLAALAADAQSADPTWDSFTAALQRLGLSPPRASQLGMTFGPLTRPAARHLQVSMHRGSPRCADDVPEIADQGGLIMAISDLVAISSLLQ
jgi:hypothetical protein